MIDEFNLKGLNKYIPSMKRALAYMFKQECSSSSDEEMGKSPDDIEKSAQTLYGLVHARYIHTEQGTRQMAIMSI